MEETPTPNMGAPAPTSGPASAPAPTPAPSQGLVGDLMGVVKMNGGTMMSVAKNPAYFVHALVIYALVQAASVFSQWWQVKEANEVLAAFDLDLGMGPLDFVKSGVFGYVAGLVLMAWLYFVATKWFKGRMSVDMKGFITLYCFIAAPMVLMVIPYVGWLSAIWTLVLFFAVMKNVFGFTFWKTLGVAIVAGFIWGIVMAPLGSILGVMGYSASFGDGGFSFNSGSSW